MKHAPQANTALILGGLLGVLGVAAGAFGAHALRDLVGARDLEIWRTATHYQQVHAALLVAVGLAGRQQWSRALTAASAALTVGIVVFAGTLELMVLGGPRWLGAITPVGGLGLMAGWVCLLLHGVAGRKTATR